MSPYLIASAQPDASWFSGRLFKFDISAITILG